MYAEDAKRLRVGEPFFAGFAFLARNGCSIESDLHRFCCPNGLLRPQKPSKRPKSHIFSPF